MPTPMPIIDENWGVNDGTFRKDAPTPSNMKPAASASSAVRMGTPIAATEPNAISRITTAAPIP